MNTARRQDVKVWCCLIHSWLGIQTASINISWPMYKKIFNESGAIMMQIYLLKVSIVPQVKKQHRKIQNEYILPHLRDLHLSAQVINICIHMLQLISRCHECFVFRDDDVISVKVIAPPESPFNEGYLLIVALGKVVCHQQTMLLTLIGSKHCFWHIIFSEYCNT